MFVRRYTIKRKCNFFEILYENFYIYYVNAKRSINSNPYGRGSISELLISNYNPK